MSTWRAEDLLSYGDKPTYPADEIISELSREGFPSAWIALSGPPCAGKTTLLNELRLHGLEVRSEVAEEMRLALMQAMPGVEEPWRIDPSGFTLNVLRTKVERENNADPDRPIVWDRALPDTLPFCERNSVSLSAHSIERLKGRYRIVLMCEALPFETAEFRDRSDVTNQHRLGERFEDVYRELGYDIRKIPKLPIEERVSYVMTLLKSLEIVDRNNVYQKAKEFRE